MLAPHRKLLLNAHQILDAITRIGRPRKYKDRAERERAYRERKKKARVESRAMVSSLKELLVDAARHNVDLSAGEEPIRYLITRRPYDLEDDILPTVARTVPELPRPLRSWDAQVAYARDSCRARPAHR